MAPRVYFVTEYKRGLALYGAGLWARDWRQARRYAKRRGIGEVVTGKLKSPLSDDDIPVSELLRSRGLLRRKIHGLCWLGLLATSSKVATAADFFDDEAGVIHQLVHSVNQNGDVTWEGRATMRRVMLVVKRMQQQIPGYLPPYGHRAWGAAARRRGYV